MIEKTYDLTKLGAGEHEINARARTPNDIINNPQSFEEDSKSITNSPQKIEKPYIQWKGTAIYFSPIKYATHFQMFYRIKGSTEPKEETENYLKLNEPVDGIVFINVDKLIGKKLETTKEYEITLVLHSAKEFEDKGIFTESDESNVVNYIPKPPLQKPTITGHGTNQSDYEKLFFKYDNQNEPESYQVRLFKNGEKQEKLLAYSSGDHSFYINISEYLSSNYWDEPIVFRLQATPDGTSKTKDYTDSEIGEPYIYFVSRDYEFLEYTRSDGEEPEPEPIKPEYAIAKDNKENFLLSKKEILNKPWWVK